MEKRQFRLNLNIGTVIFGAIFLYMIITFILFVTHRHVETYQVITGPLSGNETTTAIILRDEDVVMSNTTGYVNHFVSNGSKIGKKQLVCAVTSSLVPSEYKALTPSEYIELRNLASRSSRSFDTVHFESINDLKFEVLGTLWDADSVSSGSGNFYTATGDGYVTYSADDYVYYREDDIEPELFKTSEYSVPKIKNQSIVSSGDALYRITYDESWSIYFPITDKQLVRMAEKKNLRVKFLKDGTSESGKLTFFENKGQRYARITFSSGMYRYLDDRFVDIELITNNETGLKIPVSSIVSKEFYKVPTSYELNPDSTDAAFNVEIRNDDGTKAKKRTEVTIYAEVQDKDTEMSYYYVDTKDLNEGDILINPITNEKFTVSPKGSLDGVYCVNKGYAVFRKISVIDQNEEYAIVSPNTSYGLSQFDFIVKNGNAVKESDVIY